MYLRCYLQFRMFSLWYRLVVSNVLLTVPKNESDLRCTKKADFTVY